MDDIQNNAGKLIPSGPSTLSKYDAIWWNKFDLLKRIKRAGGDPNVPLSHETHGRWVAQQRALCFAGKLSQERKEALESLGIRLSKKTKPPRTPRPPNAQQRHWSIRMASVRAIYVGFKEGKDVLGAGKLNRIGKWFAQQLSALDAGNLKPEQQQAVEEIPLRWDKARGWYAPKGVNLPPLIIPALIEKPAKLVVAPPRAIPKVSSKARKNLSRQPFQRPLFAVITPEVRVWWGNFDKLEADWLADKNPLLNPDLALQEWLQIQLKAALKETLSPSRIKALRHIGVFA